MSDAFVGRAVELARLKAIVSGAANDEGPTAGLIAGETGSGKTRLLGEVLESARHLPLVRLAGFETASPAPLAAVGGLLRRLIEAPAHGQTLDELVFGRGGSGARDLIRVFEAAYRASAELAPLVVAVDDLQWVDEQSLGLLHYLMDAAASGDLALALLAATRPTSAARSFWAGLEAAIPTPRMALVELGPLDRDDGVALARAVDPTIDEAIASDVWLRAEGSPFWIEALARGSDTGAARLVEERLLSASPDAGTLMAALAVGGRPCPRDEVSIVLGWPQERVAHAADELVRRGLATVGLGGTRLAHDLIREEVVRAVPRARRRELHASFADAIESLGGDEIQRLCEALAHRQAAGLPGADLALRILTSPGRRLIGRDGLTLVASLLQATALGDGDRLELERGLARLAADLGEHEVALESWSHVARLDHDAVIRQSAEIEAARAARRLGRADEAHAHLERARHAASGSPVAEVNMDALEAELLLWADHDTTTGSRIAARALQRAEAMVAASGGVDGLLRDELAAYLAALEAAGDAALQQDRTADVMRSTDEIAQVALSLDDEVRVGVMLHSGFRLVRLGRRLQALEVFDSARIESERLILPLAQAEACDSLTSLLVELGRLPEARAMAVATQELQRRAQPGITRVRRASSAAFAIELSTGDVRTALERLRQQAAEEDDPHFRMGIYQTIAEWQGRYGSGAPTDVVPMLTAAQEDSERASCPRCGAELAAVTVELLARVGRVDEARRRMGEWGFPDTDGNSMNALRRDRARAVVAMAEGRAADAAALLQSLHVAFEAEGLAREVLLARLDLGRALAEEDHARAVKVLSSAAALAESMGAVNEGRVVSRELRKLGVRAWRRGAAGEGSGLASLTQREWEIARLVADGRSNREAAEALFLSPKTVERHLTNILAKLGVRNRTEMAALVHAEGTGFPR